MSVCVVVSASKNSSLVDISVESVRLAGYFAILTSFEESIPKVSSGDFCHILLPGTIVLPSFYQAMITACDYLQADYSYCNLLSLLGENNPAKSSSDKFSFSQLLVRGWVLRELVSLSPQKILSSIISEYKGVEVPHILCIEVNK
jgi:hypothetical protein